jgi:hypothetical protein
MRAVQTRGANDASSGWPATKRVEIKDYPDQRNGDNQWIRAKKLNLKWGCHVKTTCKDGLTSNKIKHLSRWHEKQLLYHCVKSIAEQSDCMSNYWAIILSRNDKSTFNLYLFAYIQDDSKLLSGFPWSLNGNPDNNLESSCITTLLHVQFLPVTYFLGSVILPV